MGPKETGSKFILRIKRGLSVRPDADRDWTPSRPANSHSTAAVAPTFNYESFFGSSWNEPERLLGTFSINCGTDNLFDSIPNEVLESIFAFCVANGPQARMNTLDPYQAPWALTKVNSRWRSIALARKSLWCNIIIQGPWGDQHGFTAIPTKSMLRLLLSRSKPLPLTIYFAPGDSLALLQAMKSLLPLLAASSPRWRDVHFEFPSVTFLAKLGRISGKLPLLERVYIQLNRALESADEQRLDMFQVAPALTHVSIRGLTRISQFPLPFSQLLEYEGPREDWVNLLRVAKNLETCHVELGRSYITPDPPIIHHRLRSLHVPATCVLLSMEVPSLTELTITSRADMMFPQDLTTLISFMQRSCCRLKRLTLHDVALGDREPLASFFEYLPHLQYLDLGESSPIIRWYFLCTLLTIENDAPLIPCLESLTLSSDDPTNTSPPSPSALGQMLKSRFNASPRFVAGLSKSLLPLGIKSLDLEEGMRKRLTITEPPSLELSPTNDL